MRGEGEDLRIVGIGKMVGVGEESGEKVGEEEVSVEVMDLG